MKRHRIAVVICLLVIVAGASVVLGAYHGEQIKSQISAAHAKAQAAAEQKARELAVKNEQRRIDQECQKEEAAYNQLTVKQKATVAVPNCHLQLLK